MRLAVIVVVLLLVIGACFMISCSGSHSMSTQIPTGPVTATQVDCPATGPQGASCMALDISCPNIPNYTAYVKIITPTNPIGTIIFTTGGGGNTLYETDTYGTTAVQNVVDAGYEAVQLTFGAPFSNGAGWEDDVNGLGARAAACRYAMVAQWLAQQTPSVPLCATGNSAGGQNIGEGLAHYGLGSYLSFAEITSGPPFSRVDLACNPTTVDPEVEPCSNATVGMSVGVTDATNFIDPAYPGPWCSQQIQTGNILHQAQFLNDSITSPDAVLNYPSTTVRFVYGGQDLSSAIRQGLNYKSQITSSTSVGCVADAPHNLDDALDGAQAIAADLIANCHK
jgi:hypothetical protein